jgi:hypothetical protein
VSILSVFRHATNKLAVHTRPAPLDWKRDGPIRSVDFRAPVLPDFHAMMAPIAAKHQMLTLRARAFRHWGFITPEIAVLGAVRVEGERSACTWIKSISFSPKTNRRRRTAPEMNRSRTFGHLRGCAIPRRIELSQVSARAAPMAHTRRPSGIPFPPVAFVFSRHSNSRGSRI